MKWAIPDGLFQVGKRKVGEDFFENFPRIFRFFTLPWKFETKKRHP